MHWAADAEAIPISSPSTVYRPVARRGAQAFTVGAYWSEPAGDYGATLVREVLSATRSFEVR